MLFFWLMGERREKAMMFCCCFFWAGIELVSNKNRTYGFHHALFFGAAILYVTLRFLYYMSELPIRLAELGI